MLGALSAAIIFVGCGTAVGRATGGGDESMTTAAFSAEDIQMLVDAAIVGEREKQEEERGTHPGTIEEYLGPRKRTAN